MLKHKVVVMIIGLFFIVTLTSCKTTEIIDLLHKETDEIHIGVGYNFSDPTTEKYRINGVLFIPYFNHVFANSNNEEIDTYSLHMASYKQADNNKKVIINSVSVEGTKNVIFNGQR